MKYLLLVITLALLVCSILNIASEKSTLLWVLTFTCGVFYLTLEDFNYRASPEDKNPSGDE